MGDLTISGSARLDVNGIALTGNFINPDNAVVNAIVLTSTNGITVTVHGNAVVAKYTNDFDWGDSYAFTVPEGASLTVLGGTTLDLVNCINGTISNSGKMTINGTLLLPEKFGGEDVSGAINGLKLDGTGNVKVNNNVYFTDGSQPHSSRQTLDFTNATEDAGVLDTDGYHWDNANATLTLKNLHLLVDGENAIKLPDTDVKLALEGMNTVTSISTDKELKSGTIIQSGANGSLIISGDGTLRASSDSDAPGIWAEHKLVIESGTLLEGESANSSIMAGAETAAGSLEMKGGTLKLGESQFAAYGDLTISGGTVKVGGIWSIGLETFRGKITISGGTVIASMQTILSTRNGFDAAPICGQFADIFITGGTVKADGISSHMPYGIFSMGGSIAITGGSIDASGLTAGIALFDLGLDTEPWTLTASGMTAVTDPANGTIKSAEIKSQFPDEEPAMTFFAYTADETLILNGRNTPENACKTVKLTETPVISGGSGGGTTPPSTVTGSTITASANGNVSDKSVTAAVAAAGDGNDVIINAASSTKVTLSGAAAAAVVENGSSLNVSVKGGGEITVQPGVLSGLNLSKTDKLSVGMTPAANSTAKAPSFEVNLTVNSTNIHELGGSMRLTFPVNSAWNGLPVIVAHIHADGSTTFSRSTVKDGKSSINVNDLSTFTVRLASDMPAAAFTDVTESAYYYGAVNWAVSKGVTSGTSATTFNPNGICTRAQTVTFLWRAMGSPEPTTTSNPFTDVSADAYYYKAVLWAVEKGITSGTGATAFSPDAVCSRSQVVTFLWRAEGKPTVNYAMSFTDVAADAYYAEAVRWAVSEGITGGTSATTFAPVGNCSRAQIVTFLYRAIAQ